MKTPHGHHPTPNVHSRPDDGNAFLRDNHTVRRHRSNEEVSEMMGENFLASATMGGQNAIDENLLEGDLDGLEEDYVVTSQRTEMAYDVDASNPFGSSVEPLPRVNGGQS